jgi:hypothetical protein
MKVPYSIPENAEVISSIGVALSMVRDVVERIVPNPTQSDIAEIKKEAIDSAIGSGACPDTIEVHIEIDSQSGKITAIATGSTEVKTTDLLKECDEKEAEQLAKEDFGNKVTDIELSQKTDNFYVYQGEREGLHPVRIVDKKGFIKVQCASAVVIKCKCSEYAEVVTKVWNEHATFKTDSVLRPDYYLCIGPRVCDYSSVELDQNLMLMNLDIMDRNPEEEIIIVGSVNDI